MSCEGLDTSLLFDKKWKTIKSSQTHLSQDGAWSAHFGLLFPLIVWFYKHLCQTDYNKKSEIINAPYELPSILVIVLLLLQLRFPFFFLKLPVLTELIFIFEDSQPLSPRDRSVDDFDVVWSVCNRRWLPLADLLPKFYLLNYRVILLNWRI